jgi:AraC-like DNA-binding protein
VPYRSYTSSSLEEGSSILNREWSPHRLILTPGQSLRMRFSIRTLSPDMSVSQLAYGTPTRVFPQERAEVLLVQMPCAGSGLASYSWGNKSLDERHYGLVDVRRVTQVQCSGELDALILRIRLARLEAWLEQALGRKPVRELVFQPSIEAGTPSWHAWAPVAAALGALQRNPESELPSAALRALEEMVLSTLLLALPNSYSEDLRRPPNAAAPRHIRRAEEFVQRTLPHPVTVEDIAREAQVSVRTLFDGFRRFRQTTPAAYVRSARLAAAHEDLLRGEDSVANVARRWGFLHAGHFAAQYQRQYGEAPAMTMRLHSSTQSQDLHHAKH